LDIIWHLDVMYCSSSVCGLYVILYFCIVMSTKELNKEAVGVLQRIKRPEENAYDLAEKYYKIISVVNNLKLTEREVQLVAYTAIKGNISYASNRNEFCEKYESSEATVNNIISKLKRIGVLVKDGNKTKVNPVILLDFNKQLTLEIKLLHGDGR